MGLYATNGNRIAKAALATTPGTTDPSVVITNDTYESFRYPSEPATVEGSGRRLKWKAGQTVKQSEIDAAYPAATITSVTGTAHAAGGNQLTIHGTNLDGVSAATLGGTPCTLVTVVDPQTVTCNSPAKAQGTYPVAVTDDSGTATLNNAVTVVA